MARNQPQIVNLEIDGLYLHPNSLSEVPRGALKYADNVTLRRESLAETRRGFNRFKGPLVDEVDELYTYRTRVFALANDVLYRDNDTDNTWAAFDTDAVSPDITNGFPVQSVSAKQNFYYTTDEEIRKLDDPEGVVSTAGIPQALAGTATTTGTSGFMPADTQVAYRILWQITDANDNLIVGAPSQRIVVQNAPLGSPDTQTSKDVNLTFTIPDGITTSHYFEIYRSLASASATSAPDDELQLVISQQPTAGEIAAGEITILDNVPDVLRGQDLYTNSTQEGVLQSNLPPPFAKCIEVFRNHMFFGNTRQPAQGTVQLISVDDGGSPQSVGLQPGDTITIGSNIGSPASLTYTAAASGSPLTIEDPANGIFALVQDNSPALNIEETAISLARVINQDPRNTEFYCFYNLDPGASPGQLLIRRRDSQTATFTWTSNRPGAWLQGDSYPLSFTTETGKNIMYVSKFSEPEAVPIVNFFQVGDEDKEILSLKANRDHLFIFKEDGIFRLTGSDITQFRIDQHDNTAFLLAPRTVKLLDNRIFCLTDQGVTAVTNNGVSVVSRAIEREVLRVTSDDFTNFKEKTFATRYESEREYALCCLDETSDTRSTQQYVYNTFTRGWTRWTLNVSAGILNQNDGRLYYAGPSIIQTGSPLTNENIVYKERKSFTRFDYTDESFNVAIIAFDNTDQSAPTITVDDATNIVAGYTIKQDNLAVLIEEVNGNVLTVERPREGWTIAGLGSPQLGSPQNLGSPQVGSPYPADAEQGLAEVFTPIPQIIEWLEEDADNPNMLKRWNEITLFFDDAIFSEATLGVQSNFSITYYEAPLVPRITGLGEWGLFPWGTGVPWGGTIPPNYKQPIRTMWPQLARVSPWASIRVSLSQAFTSFSLGGYSLFYKDLSSRIRG